MFSDILKFLINHYELILSIILVLTSFILALVKKKPVLNKIDEIYVYILEKLPELISAVEVPKQGETKKQTVLDLIKVLVAKEFNFYDWDHIKEFVSDAIEYILLTPQKKK